MIIANWKSNIVDMNQWTRDFDDEYIVNERLQSTIFGVAPPSLYICLLYTSPSPRDED